jgi:hypothetical protein
MIVGYFLVKAVVRAWRQPSGGAIAATTCLLMIVMAGSTHAFVKIRPMKTVPVLGYHVFVGVLGVSLLISYGLMMAWRRWPSTAARVAVTAAVWIVIFYGALARPIMLNHMAAEAGLPGLYPNPMNALRVMLGRPEDPTGDLAGFQLIRNLPKAEAAAPVAPAAAPAPAPAPAVKAATPTQSLGDAIAALPESVIDLSAWDRLPDVRVTPETGGYAIDGNSMGGYQLMSPLMAVPASTSVLVRARGTTERGRICIGVFDSSQQRWLHAPATPESEFIFDTASNRAVRLVFAACPGDSTAARVHVQSMTYAMLRPANALR